MAKPDMDMDTEHQIDLREELLDLLSDVLHRFQRIEDRLSLLMEERELR